MMLIRSRACNLTAQPTAGGTATVPCLCRGTTSSSRSSSWCIGAESRRSSLVGVNRVGSMMPCPMRHNTSSLGRKRHDSQVVQLSPFDAAWGTQINGESLASQLFAASLFPYLAFLFYLTRSGKAPRLVVIGFWFLLAFVGATIPAGIYAKQHYGTSLANVDWLHGSAESLLTITNLFVVLGLREGIRQAEQEAALKGGASSPDATGNDAAQQVQEVARRSSAKDG